MNDLITRVENAIKEQMKDNIEGVLIDVNDLNELGYGIDPNKTGKAYVDVGYLKIALERYKFKGRVKVDIKPKTFKELEQEIKDIERGGDDE